MKKLKDGKLLEEQGYQQSDAGLPVLRCQIGFFLHVFKKEVENGRIKQTKNEKGI